MRNIIKYSERLPGPLRMRMRVTNLRSQQQQTTAVATDNDHSPQNTRKSTGAVSQSAGSQLEGRRSEFDLMGHE